MGIIYKILGSLALLSLLGYKDCLGAKKWSGHDHHHGHGWMKLHNNRHHDASSKLSEAYVKFHKLGDGSTKGGSSSGGKGGSGGGGKGSIFESLFGGGGSMESESDQGGWSGASQMAPIQMMVPIDMSGGGGWGQQAAPMKMQMSSGWGEPAPMEMSGGWGMMMPAASSMSSGWGSGGGMMSGGAKPTGWASAGGGMQQMQMQQQTGWATGDFGKFKPTGGSGNKKGHFNFELPSGKPAYIQKLKPLIDLPKLAFKGWGW